jgi:RNA polymerase sigma-70 factor (ECF subfamily)
VDRPGQRRIVDAFLAATRDGDFEALLAALDPEVVLRADPVAIQTAAARAAEGAAAPSLAPEIRGARAVAAGLSGRARGARPAVVGGVPGAAWAPDGVVRAAFAFSFADGRIVAIDIIMDPAHLRALDVVV